MIQDQFHPLDEIGVFGCTAHGLVRLNLFYGNRLFIDGTAWPLPGRIPYDPHVLQIVKKPAIEPVPLAPDVLLAERALGRVWQNYALLLTGFNLFFKPIGGWIYFASNGVRWVIQPGDLPQPQAGQPYSVTLTCKPFGYFDELPAEPVTLTLSLADIEQLGAGFRFAAIHTISSAGTRTIIVITQAGVSFPTGFLEIALSDVDGVLQGSLTVHLSQEAVRGEWEQNYTLPIAALESRELFPLGTLSPEATEARFPDGGGSFVMTIDSTVSRVGGPGAAVFGNTSLSAKRLRRVFGLVFDDVDHLVEFAFDTYYSLEMDYPEFAGEASGSASGSSTYDAQFTDATWSVEVNAELSRTVSEQLSVEVALLRDGERISAARVDEARSAEQVRSISYSGAGFCPGLAATHPGKWLLRAVGTGANYFELNPGFAAGPPSGQVVAAEPFGGAWDTSQSAESVTGASQLRLLTKMPTGPVDADSLNAALAFRETGTSTDQAVQFAVRLYRGMARLLRTQPRPKPEFGTSQYEYALVCPHAVEFERGRGLLNPSEAYHPVTHELVTGDIDDLPQTFI